MAFVNNDVSEIIFRVILRQEIRVGFFVINIKRLISSDDNFRILCGSPDDTSAALSLKAF
jgi:hypothetical protein